MAGSWMWKKLLKMRDLAKSFLKVEVNNGKHTSFWYENWSSLGYLKDRMRDGWDFALGILENEMIVDVLNRRRRRHSHRIQFLNEVENEIDKMRSRAKQEEDVPLWRRSDNKYTKVFSTKKTWQCIRQAHPECDWNRGVWREMVGGILHDDYTTNWAELLGIISCARTCPTETFITRYAFQTLAHSIWRERNSRKHGEAPLDEKTLAKMVDKMIRLKLLLVKGKGKEYLEVGLIKWITTRP